MKIVQILPELNGGGVERGTLEVASWLVREGHESIVISNGGRMAAELEQAGSRHIRMPVHRKSPASLGQIPRLREFFAAARPDIIHVRSRLPAWLAWLAWKSLDRRVRPRLVTTVHGFYSVNAYSAIMTKGEAVIAVSESVRDYVLKNYPQTDPARVRVIHRGVDPAGYPHGFVPPAAWLADWQAAHPMLAGRIPLLMPARLTRWKGQEDFIRLIARLIDLGQPVHGLIVGEPHPKKLAFLDELKTLAVTLGVAGHLSFLGHRTDLREIMAVCSLVVSLSTDPEAFGRVSLEALALGKPVVGYNHGGVGNVEAAVAATLDILDQRKAPSSIGPFTLQRMLDATVEVYADLLDTPV
ncbi:MAG: glycosyltransferase family 4 protein [Verrucomicrobia bacterium]|nr:glycosyltransferase family 4 protein [Verrucomicrobiota bacterium]